MAEDILFGPEDQFGAIQAGAELLTNKGQPGGYAAFDDLAAHVALTTTAHGGVDPLTLRRDFGLNPSMTPSALSTAINNAIQSAISGRRQLSLGYEMWPVDQPLLINGPLSLIGDGCFERWGSRATSSAYYPATVDGAGIIQTSPAADGIQITATGEGVNLGGLCVRFDGSHRWLNTGRGIFAQPPAYLTGRNFGLQSPRWNDVRVFGHDGNHYAFELWNAIYGTFDHLHSFGGGGLRLYGSGAFNYGNHTFNNPYLNVIAGGSAHCYSFGADPTFPSQVTNLCTFIRPQGWVADAAIGGVTAPSSAQRLVDADGQTQRFVWVQPDMESNVGSGVVWPIMFNEIIGGQTTPVSANAITTNPSNNTFFQNQSGFAQLYSVAVQFNPTAGAAATFEVAVNGSAASTSGAAFPLGKLANSACPTKPANSTTGVIEAFTWVIPSGAYCQLSAVNASRLWANAQAMAAGR